MPHISNSQACKACLDVRVWVWMSNAVCTLRAHGTMGKPRPNRMNPRLKRIMPRPLVIPPSAGARIMGRLEYRGCVQYKRILRFRVRGHYEVTTSILATCGIVGDLNHAAAGRVTSWQMRRHSDWQLAACMVKARLGTGARGPFCAAPQGDSTSRRQRAAAAPDGCVPAASAVLPLTIHLATCFKHASRCICKLC